MKREFIYNKGDACDSVSSELGIAISEMLEYRVGVWDGELMSDTKFTIIIENIKSDDALEVNQDGE